MGKRKLRREIKLDTYTDLQSIVRSCENFSEEYRVPLDEIRIETDFYEDYGNTGTELLAYCYTYETDEELALRLECDVKSLKTREDWLKRELALVQKMKEIP